MQVKQTHIQAHCIINVDLKRMLFDEHINWLSFEFHIVYPRATVYNVYVGELAIFNETRHIQPI